MEKIQIKAMIRREMKRKNLKKVDLAKKLSIKSSSIHSLLAGPNLQVQRLADLSLVLEYNFFREIAKMLPIAEPDYTVKIDETEKEQLKEQVKMLHLENSILRQTLKDIAGR